MKHSVYILFSISLDSYYIGHTGSSMEERLRHHLTNHKGYTARAKDWNVVYVKSFQSKSDAYQRELQIKRQKSRKYIETLINNHE